MSHRVTAVIVSRKRPAPFRTRKLSLIAPMVLHSGGCGRVGRRRTSSEKGSGSRRPPPAQWWERRGPAPFLIPENTRPQQMRRDRPQLHPGGPSFTVTSGGLRGTGGSFTMPGSNVGTASCVAHAACARPRPGHVVDSPFPATLEHDPPSTPEYRGPEPVYAAETRTTPR